LDIVGLILSATAGASQRNPHEDGVQPHENACRKRKNKARAHIHPYNQGMLRRVTNLPVLLTLMVLFAVMPGFISAVVIADRQRQQALANVQTQNVSLLRLVAQNQSQIIANTRSLLNLIAVSPDVRDRNLAGCQSLLSSVAQSSNRFDGLAVVNADQSLWCLSGNITRTQAISAPLAGSSPEVGHSVTFTDGIAGVADMYRRAVASGDFTIGEYFIGDYTGRPYLALTQPIKNDGGQIDGYVIAGLSLDAMNASMNSLDLPADYVVAVLDRRGTFLVRWPNDYLVGQNVADLPIAQRVMRESLDSEPQQAPIVGVDGINRLYAFQQLPGTPESDLFVYAGIAPEIAYASIDNDLRRNLALLTLFTIVAAGLAWLFGRRFIVEPVRKTADAAQRMGRGELTARVSINSTPNELGMLADAFNHMAAQLEQNTRDLNQRADELNQANTRLEQRVEQRTQQLQNSVNRLRDSREQLRQLSAQQRRIVEAEQTRISREVHDQIGQALTSLKIDVSSIRRKLGAAFPQALEHIAPKLAAMDAELDLTVNTTRSISRSLRPTALDTLGLFAAMDVFAHEFQARTGIMCDVTTHGDDQSLSPDMATAVYRIMQEATTNVVRHASASHVDIRLRAGPADVELRVEDNGVGMPEDKLSERTSLGMLGMEERAREFNGTVEVVSEAGAGTTVIARFSTQDAPSQD
jgi:signal transduction histidine kinase